MADLAGARKARRWRPGRRTVTAAVVVVLLAVAAGWVLLASPWLRVGDVRVEGTERVDPAAVQQIAESAEGVPLARVDSSGIADQLRAMPLVESVDITRSWPSTLVVTVHEREAVAAVPSTSGGVDLVDGDGTVLAHEDAAPQGVPVLSVNVSVAGDDALQAAIAVNASLSVEVRSRVSAIAATGPDAVTLQIIDGPLVVWGDDSRPERKAEVLLRLLVDPDVAAAETVDVSAPDAPAVTPS